MKKLSLFFVIFMICACGYKEGIVQKSEKAFIKFTGNLENAIVQIDNLEPFKLVGAATYDGSWQKVDTDTIMYEISPGKHLMKVYRGETLIINRILILDNQIVTEVRIP